MAFDEILAARVRDALTGRARLTERKMFGGIAFMLEGHRNQKAMDGFVQMNAGTISPANIGAIMAAG